MELIKNLTKEYEEYLRDESRTIGHADKIAFAKTEDDIRQIVSYCHQHDLKINVQGARTGLAGGASPLGGLVLNLSRMNKICGLRRDEQGTYYLKVQPGVLLTDVRKALANKSFDLSNWPKQDIECLRNLKAGQLFFSPDPTETTASIGGMAACNAAGARSFMYGVTRQHIQSLHVVLADGSLTILERGKHRAKGRSFSLPLADGGVLEGQLPAFDTPKVKDAGYYLRDDMDLVDIFIGSQGTLGIISELEIKLMPAPQLVWGCTTFLPSDQIALDYVRLLRGEKISGQIEIFTNKPAAIEFFNKNALDMILKQKEITPAFQQLQELPTNYHCAIYTEFNSNDADDFWPVINKLKIAIEALGGNADHTWVAPNARELEKLLFFRHTVPETIDILIDENKKNEPCITILSTDMSVPDCHLQTLFDIYDSDLRKTDLHWVIFGHIGENHLHPNILARNKEEYLQGKELFKKWAHDVSKLEGTITAEHGSGKIKRELVRILFGDQKMAALKAYKLSLDPKDLLGPGNILS